MSCVPFGKSSPNRPSTLHVVPPHLESPDVCLACSSCGAGAHQTGAREWAHISPRVSGRPPKKNWEGTFFARPPLPTFFARLDPRRRRRIFFGNQSRLAKMSHSMAWVWGGMSPCVLLASYLRVGAWAPWEAPCTLPWPFQAMGPSEPPKMASGLQNG